MKFRLSGNNLHVIRGATDPPKYHGGGWGNGESRVLFHIKQQLEALGFDLIKKRMYKDGHMVADTQQYLRVRNDKSVSPHIYLSNDHYAVTGLDDDWNGATDYFHASGTNIGNHCILAITFDVFNKQPDCQDHVARLLATRYDRQEAADCVKLLREMEHGEHLVINDYHVTRQDDQEWHVGLSRTPCYSLWDVMDAIEPYHPDALDSEQLKARNPAIRSIAAERIYRRNHA